MNKSEYKKLTKKHLPNNTSVSKLFISFFVGGVIGFIAEFLVDFYSSFENINRMEASNLMMVTFIFISSLLTGLGIFDKLVTKFGAGLIIPITGFSHSMTSSAMEYRKEGMVTGIGMNIFKLSGTVILYGVVSAYIFGIIRFIIFGG
ncbi:MAG: SpoVA/SpoVAEb family sporulation membrane protein [Bacilli bacterium]|nr:SpoVA/SpoVAEb family sporulation membrane protein [Bacilli bacterium]